MKQFLTRSLPCSGAAALAALFAAGSLTAVPAAEAQRDQTRPGAVRAYAYQPRLGMAGAAIRVCWERPDRVPSSDVLGYVVWRSDRFSPDQVVGGLDGDASRCFIDAEGTRTVTAWSGDPPSDDAGARVQFLNVPGLIPGETYAYSVASAYVNGLQDRDGNGLPDFNARFMSPKSPASLRVTALAPPSLSAVNGQALTPGGPDPRIDPRAFEVEWLQTPGADSYVVWISDDPRFPRGRTLQLKPVRTIPVDQGGPATVRRAIDVRRGSLRRAGRVFVAVGARNSRDRYLPRPFGAIFSAPVQLEVEPGPPPPP